MAKRPPERGAKDEGEALAAETDSSIQPMTPMDRFKSLARRLISITKEEMREAEQDKPKRRKDQLSGS